MPNPLITLEPDVYERLLEFLANDPEMTPSAAASTFIDEALRCAVHPGIVFRPGPTGRRAALAAGPDVWEVIGAVQALQAEDPTLSGDRLIDALAGVTGISRPITATALAYYRAYPADIDSRIRANEHAADIAEIQEVT